MRHLLLVVGMILVGTARAEDPPAGWIEGRVVDAQGRPVPDVNLASFWSANGERLDAEGKPLGSLKTDEDVARFWSNVGQMGPWSQRVTTAHDGTFRVPLKGTRTHHMLAMDKERARGGLGIVSAGQEGQPITIKLVPLVRVHGQIRGPETDLQPKWTHIYTERAEEPERPIDSFRIIGCGSFNADFAMLLPPGKYSLHAYNNDSNAEVIPHPVLTITGTERDMDLGTLKLSPVPQGLFTRLEKTRSEKQIKALKDRVGDGPPPIFAADVRGVASDWQPGHARGKWQLIEFWGLDCSSCLGHSLPAMMKFQLDHASQADQFEIITVFLDVDGKIRTIPQLDAALKPIVQHVWGGRSLPFPTVVDPSYQTIESYGLSGYGEQVLINPEGRTVAGDLETLRGILDKP